MSLSCSSSSFSVREDREPMAAGNSHVAAVKGKRTKRPRSGPPSPPRNPATSSSSVSSSADFSGSTVTEEEEDMANCLILLAQGQAALGVDDDPQAPPRFAYECKTCSKCFPTFQALGGHRASHKRPRVAADQEKPKKPVAGDCEQPQATVRVASFINKQPATPPMATKNGKQRMHECSICGLEFTSGQALGGHMRRHRPSPASEPVQEQKEKSFLSLDLNLPAPDDDGDDAALFAFPAKPPAILLVDCHY